MNFELKTMDVAQAASEKCDLLVLLVPDGFAPGKDALGALVAQAIKAKDLDTKPGKSLHSYQVAGVAARRVALAGIGAGDARAVRQAVAAVAPALKQGAPKRAVVCVAGAASAAAVEAVVRGVAQASYVYTATKSKAEARSLARVLVGVHDARAMSAPFERAVAVSVGVELAREWGNRPANHATPNLLAQAAKGLAKHPGIQCKVLGPAEVAHLGMGAFMAVARGAEEPLRFIELRYQGAAKTQAPVVLVGLSLIHI